MSRSVKVAAVVVSALVLLAGVTTLRLVAVVVVGAALLAGWRGWRGWPVAGVGWGSGRDRAGPARQRR